MFPVVGVGASAGGLDAFKRLLTNISENSGMAYVLVQHLSPTHESILPEILQRITKIPVHEITDDIHIAPNHIYTIPSNKILIATDGVLCLSPREKFKTNLSIDIFFTSLAEVHKELAAGVVLSGTGSDGTLGLKAIKEYGGFTIAQDESSAAFNDMPQHAIDAGVVDFILKPEEIPARLLQISNNYPTVKVDGKEEPLPKDDEATFKQILLLLHQRSGVDFTYYKQSTIRRRIARRMGMRNKEKQSGYLKFLRSDKAEQDALFQDMLIPVTSFFRDPKTFDTLCKSIFPLLFKNRAADEPVRIWVAGCSTGEEVYSLAICLHEFFGKKTATIPIQIFASDISEMAIKKARTAIYSKADLHLLSEERLKQYFHKTNGHYEVNKIIRDICVFAPHNFLKDPPFAKMDLISCRNVLIYLDNFFQKKALTTFHYSLKQTGYLLLGKSETVSAATELFTLYGKHEKIYSRKPVPGRFMHVATELKEETLATQTNRKTKYISQTVHTDFRKSGEALLLTKYTPAAVIVNEQMDIVHIHGSITPFLEPSPGKPTFNLLKMAREGLGFELRNALHKAKTTHGPVIKEGIPSRSNARLPARAGSDGNNKVGQGKQHIVTIEVVPLDNTIEPHYLILFTKTEIPSPISPEKGVRTVKTKQFDEAKQHIVQLENELSQAREDMRSISEEQEAANEELQSANEELQSSNEEMQSLNEELETSKEELQSTNEELIIVNQELLEKQEQLNAARLYSDSIVTTIRHPLIVLDKNLRIKTANVSFYNKFNTTEDAIEGKLFYEIQNYQWDDAVMRSLLEKILPQKERFIDFEISLSFPLVGERFLLMNAQQIVNESTAQKLILLAIEDVTDRKILETQLQESEKRSGAERLVLYNSFMNAPSGIAILKGDTHIFEFANTFYEKIIGKKVTFGKTAREVLPEIEQQGLLPILDNAFATGEPFITHELAIDFSVYETGKSQLSYVDLAVQPIKAENARLPDGQGNTERLLINVIDVTEMVMARKNIEVSEKRFRNILSQSLMAIAIFKGTEMTVTFANEPMLGLLGKGTAVINKPLLEGVPELKDQVFPKLLADVYATGVPFEGYETKAILVQNGTPTEVYFNFIYQPYRDIDDTITGVTVIASEVTEQVLAKKQIEENANQFRFLAESVPQKIFTAKSDGNIDYFNPQWMEFTGLSFEQIRDWGWMQFVHPDDKEENMQVWQHAVDTGEPLRFEHRFRSAAGDYRWHLSLASVLRDENENILKWFGTSTDIHDQKKKEQEKDDFISIASHELKTPLTTAKGYIELLLLSLSKENESQLLYASKADQAINRLKNLITELLDVSKIQHGKLDYTITTFDFNKLLDETIENIQQHTPSHQVIKTGSNLSEISGDKDRLQQVIINLLTNAIKYSPQANEVLVNVVQKDKKLQVSVQDYGIGLSKQHVDKIFERYYRVAEHATNFQGLGIGLYISYDIIKRHQGTMWAEGEINKGSTFYFTIPI